MKSQLAIKRALVFGVLGPLIGTAAYYAIVRDQQTIDVLSMLLSGLLFGFIPALLTGALSTRSMPSTVTLLVGKSAAIGALVSLLFFAIVFGVVMFGPQPLDRHLIGFVAPFAGAGSVAAAVCALVVTVLGLHE